MHAVQLSLESQLRYIAAECVVGGCYVGNLEVGIISHSVRFPGRPYEL